MGSLAAAKPGKSEHISGILIKRNFNYHIVAPTDLGSRFSKNIAKYIWN